MPAYFLTKYANHDVDVEIFSENNIKVMKYSIFIPSYLINDAP